MTWFKHRCWYCKHESRDVWLVGGWTGGPPDGSYQCNDKEACEKRRQWLEGKVCSP